MKKTGLLVTLGGFPLLTWAHGDHDFHGALAQALHGLGHAEVFGAIAVLAVLGVCVGRYLSKLK